jgi:hypothetical protein
LAPALVNAPGRSGLAHLIAFRHDGVVECDGPIGPCASYFLR